MKNNIASTAFVTLYGFWQTMYVFLYSYSHKLFSDMSSHEKGFSFAFRELGYGETYQQMVVFSKRLLQFPAYKFKITNLWYVFFAIFFVFFLMYGIKRSTQIYFCSQLTSILGIVVIVGFAEFVWKANDVITNYILLFGTSFVHTGVAFIASLLLFYILDFIRKKTNLGDFQE